MKQRLFISLLSFIIQYESHAFSSRTQLHMNNGDRVEQGSMIPNNVASTTAAPFETKTRKAKNVHNRQKGYQSIKAAPLVDSTLLRFLSAQRDQIVQNKDEAKLYDSAEILDDEMQLGDFLRNSTDGVNRLISDLQETYEECNLSSSSSSSSSSDKNIMGDTPAASLSWFTQYNAHLVARKLIALGAAKECAAKAGATVQNYSLGRTTRQRVRKFLRDRDMSWALGNTDLDSTYEVSTPTTDSDLRGTYHNIDEVISLLSDAGLTGRDIAAIFTHTPSVSMMRAKRDESANNTDQINSTRKSQGVTLEETLERAYFGVLCSSIRLRKYDARKVLRNCPGLLTKRGSISSEEIISILSNLGVSPTSLCRDKAALPILLSRSPASLFRFVAFLSSDAIRMPLSQIGPFIRRSECSKVLDLVAPLPPSRGNLFDDETSILDKENLDMLPPQKIIEEGIDNAIETEISKRYKNMFDTALFLRQEIGVENLGKVISAFPDIFTLDTYEQVIPVIDFLSEDLDFDQEDIVKVLQTYPMLLGTSVDQMQSVVKHFLALEVEEEMIPNILKAFPSLLSQVDETKMTEVVEFLKQIGVSNIGRFVTRLPPVLTYSVQDELIPKWVYLTRVCQFPSFEIGRFPAYFSYPLERVIVNRFEYLRRVKKVPIHSFAIDEVLRYGDEDFAISVAQDEDGKRYSTFVKAAREARRRHAQGKLKKANETQPKNETKRDSQ